MSQLFIKPADQFMGKCDNCKYLLVYEKIGKSFLIYNYIKCEKKTMNFNSVRSSMKNLKIMIKFVALILNKFLLLLRERFYPYKYKGGQLQ